VVKPDPNHQLACERFTQLEAVEAKRRLAVESYQDEDYVASEVLSALVRARFGQHTGVLDGAASALFARIVRLVGAYLRKNSQWNKVARSSSETRKELAAYVWEKLLTDSAPVCFAEVRFVPFVEARITDYLVSCLSLKNQATSLDARHGRDEEGRKRPAAELIEDEATESPEAGAIRAQVSQALNRGLQALEPLERRAIFFYVLRDCDWALTAKYLGCSITTAKKHLKRGLQKLRGVQV
jgi:DNA-directed RNA polymerase sigma subunit (sigma70/sigma32)